MATSNNTIKVLTRDDIIKSALRKLGVIAEDQLPSTTQTLTAAEALNIVVAEFRTLGMQVWARSEYLLTLTTGQNTYVFGVGQAVNTPYPLYIYDIEMEITPYDSNIRMNNYPIIDFNLLPDTSTGTPVNYNYQPGINVGTLRIWPIPDASVPALSRMRITYQRPFEVFDASTDTPDFPQEWGNALIYHLALNLADEYSVPDNKFQRIKGLADLHLSTALSNSNEQGSLYITPNRQMYEWR